MTATEFSLVSLSGFGSKYTYAILFHFIKHDQKGQWNYSSYNGDSHIAQVHPMCSEHLRNQGTRAIYNDSQPI